MSMLFSMETGEANPPKKRSVRKRPIVNNGEFDDADDRYDYPVTRWFKQCDYPVETLKRAIISLEPSDQRQLLDWVVRKSEV